MDNIGVYKLLCETTRIDSADSRKQILGSLRQNAKADSDCDDIGLSALSRQDTMRVTSDKREDSTKEKTANLIISGFALNQNNPLTELVALLRDAVTLSLRPDSISLNAEDCRRSRKSSSQRSRVRENSIFFAFP